MTRTSMRCGVFAFALAGIGSVAVAADRRVETAKEYFAGGQYQEAQLPPLQTMFVPHVVPLGQKPESMH